MLSEKIVFALNEIEDRFLEETQAMLEGKAKKPALRRTTIILLAAALVLLLAACGWAIYRATMSYREPAPEDAMQYYLNGTRREQDSAQDTDELHLNLNFGDCALILHFETEEKGTAHAYRFPEGALPELEAFSVTSLQRLFMELEQFTDLYIDPQPEEQSLQKAGMTEEEAETWDRRTEFRKDGNLGLLEPEA